MKKNGQVKTACIPCHICQHFFLLSEKACTIVKSFNRQPKHKIWLNLKLGVFIYWAFTCNQNIIMENMPIAFIKKVYFYNLFISSFTGNMKWRHGMF